MRRIDFVDEKVESVTAEAFQMRLELDALTAAIESLVAGMKMSGVLNSGISHAEHCLRVASDARQRWS